MAIAPKVLPYMAPTFELLDRRAPRRQAHPVRGRAGRDARRRPRHLSVRHLVEHRRRQRGDRLRPRARARSATCSASPRPTRRASAAGRSRPSCTDEIGRLIGERGHEFGINTGPAAPLRLVRRGAGAPDRQDLRHRRHRADQARHLDGFEEIKVCTATARRREHRPPAGLAGRAGARRAGLRDDRGLGRARPAARAPGPICRRRRSNMSGGSRN